MTQLSRRSLLAAGVGLLGGSALTACGNNGGSGGGPAAAGGKANLQFTWWGNTDRHKRTREAITAYQKAHSNVTVRPQFSGWDGYWEKLATQVAGGQPPDVIQMDYGYITDYATRQSLLALDDLVPDVIKVADFGDEGLNGGKVDGKLYGINAGVNSMCMIYNATMLKDLGIDPPDHTTTWDDFAAMNKQIAAKTPDGVFGTQNGGLDSLPFECWIRQKGKNLYGEDGKLGFTQDELAEWWTYWEDLRKSGAAATAEVQLAGSGAIEESLQVTRKAVFGFAHSNQVNAFAKLAKDEMGANMYPQGGAGSSPGQYYKPSMLFSIAAKSKNQKPAAEFINAMLTDPAIAGILGSERGISASPAMREKLAPKADENEKRVFDYIEFIRDKIGPTPAPPPPGGSEVDDEVYPFLAEQIAYGKMPIDKAVEQFFADAEKALT
jgi:multiple sugar transport system substrate-binding protein